MAALLKVLRCLSQRLSDRPEPDHGPETFITTVFCVTDDLLRAEPQKRRQRGPAPALADSEALTIESSASS